MKKQQLLVAGAGITLLLVLYFFGQTIPPKKKPVAGAPGTAAKAIDIQDILLVSKSKLDPARLTYVNRLEHAVVRGDVKNQQEDAYRQLAAFWRDSVTEGFLPFAYYTGALAKLESSEKSLTFAAQLFLENMRVQDDAGLRAWMATEAKSLFEKALSINPGNDSTKVGLGACSIFGAGAGEPQEVMLGIQQILEVSRRDSNNMYAQLMLGMGGMISGQLDKAVDRLTTVVRHQPKNIEAIFALAQINEQKGNKAAAIAWYSEAKKWIVNPALLAEIDKNIKLLQ